MRFSGIVGVLACFTLNLLGCSPIAARNGDAPPRSRADLHCASAEQCLALCGEGFATACSRLGDMFERGIAGAPKDTERAQGLWELACEGGAAPACTSLAESALAKGDTRLGLLYAGKACAGGEVSGCTQLGVMAFLGQGARLNPARAETLWTHACAFGDAVACSYLGAVRLEADAGEARTYFATACADASRAGCAALGLAYEHGLGGDRDFREALRAHLLGCDSGHAAACVYAGMLIEENSGRPDHEHRALQFYEQGCGAPSDGLCWVDEEDALFWHKYYLGDSFVRRSCHGTSTRALACYNAALGHEKGRGGLVDIDGAQALFDRSCEMGFARACRSADGFVIH